MTRVFAVLLLLTAACARAAAPVEGGDRTPADRPEVPAPEKLVAAQTAAKDITLTWQAVPGARQYRVYADPRLPGRTGNVPDAVLASNVTRMVVPNVAPGQTYKFSIEAVGARGGVSPKVEFNPVTIQAAQVIPEPPANVSASPSGPGEVTLTWSAVPGATAYFLGRSIKPDGLQMLCSQCPAETTYVDKTAKPGADHTYSVTAITPAGRTRPTLSNVLKLPDTLAGTPSGSPGTSGSSAAPAAPRPSEPEQTLANVQSPQAVKLTWTAPRRGPAPTEYRIWRGNSREKPTHGATPPLATVKGNVTEYTDQPPEKTQDGIQRQLTVKPTPHPGVVLTYFIEAVAAGESSRPVDFRVDWSQAKAMQAPPAPTNAVATVLSQDVIRFSWSQSAEQPVAGFNLSALRGEAGHVSQADRPTNVDGKTTEVVDRELPSMLRRHLEDALKNVPSGRAPLPPKETYTISAANSVGKSQPVTFRWDMSQAKYVPPGPPPAPTAAVATVLSQYEVQLSWSGDIGADHYMIARADAERGGGMRLTADAGATQVTDSKLADSEERALSEYLKEREAGRTRLPPLPRSLAYEIVASNRLGKSAPVKFTLDMSKAKLAPDRGRDPHKKP
jgi:hypothetical protein